ncbi:MAG: cation diffusion facilitator family transporter [Thermodesulfobacteriota bacterium]
MNYNTVIDTSLGRIKSLTYFGILINFLLMISKFVGGIIFGSFGLIADAFHTLSDIATDLVLLWGVVVGSKPADSSHPFGHGKFETLSGMVLSVVLIGVGIGIATEAGKSLMINSYLTPGIPVILVAIVSVLSKEFIYQKTVKTAKELDSTALHANAWHHRSDAMSSIVVIIGVVSSMFGFLPGDNIAGLFVGFMISVVGAKFMYETGKELMETSVNKEIRSSIQSIIDGHPDVKGWHQLRTRKVGRELFIDVHLLVNQDLSVSGGHLIAEEVEKIVRTSLNRPANIITHVEPDIPFERRKSESNG